MSVSIVQVRISNEDDVVAGRRDARVIAGLLGLDELEQTRIATAVSEIARNAYCYAGGGQIEFLVTTDPPQSLVVEVTDQGPGIEEPERLLRARGRKAVSGLVGAARLVEGFDIQSRPGGGTKVVLSKLIRAGEPQYSRKELQTIRERMAARVPRDPVEEVQQQNQELIGALEALRARQEELSQVNRELEDTNRGVVALYAQMEEQAGRLQEADEIKTRFLSNMSHEFRTPLNSVIALARLLLDRVDGDLTEEQERQVGFILAAAENLSGLVNDLLDLAKVEAGKVEVNARYFSVSDLFSSLRGMMRPLLTKASVRLYFDEPPAGLTLCSDEAKISQVLRNFMSNALKFTLEGEVRVSAEVLADGQTLRFSVADTGVGIAEEDQQRIFDEYVQLRHPLQDQVKGTGLGLPLSKRLAELLGGSVDLQSEAGKGSTFSLLVPLRFFAEASIEEDFEARVAKRRVLAPPAEPYVLVLEDNAEVFRVYQDFLADSGLPIVHACTIAEAQSLLDARAPIALILDILLAQESGWDFLAKIKQAPSTRGLPVYVVTVLEDRPRAMALGADEFVVKPLDREWLLEKLAGLTRDHGGKVLIIDDEETSRYLFRGLLSDTPYEILEASSGEDGLRIAREEQPIAIVLDLMMPGLSGFEVIQRLKADEATVRIPVIVSSGKALTREERVELEKLTLAVLSKHSISRGAILSTLREAIQRNSETRP